MQKTLKSVALASCLGIALSATPARASMVTVTGGFTGYQGQAGCGAFYTVIAGRDVTPSTGCDPSTMWAPLDATFDSTASFEFYGGQVNVGDFTHNALGFTPNDAQDVEKGQEFILGTMSYTNGTWFGIHTQAAFHVVLTTHSDDPLLDGHTLDDWLLLDITPTVAGNTPDDNADFVYFSNFTSVGTFKVYEKFDAPNGLGNSGTVQLKGRIGSLIPTAFINPTGGATIGRVPVTAPEPGTLAMVVLGLGMLVRSRAQR